MGKLPHVKLFVKTDKEEGALSYQNVEVEYISGKKPVLTIFDDGVQTEEILLGEYNDSQKQLHALFKEKGFIRKPGVEDAVKERRRLMEESTVIIGSDEGNVPVQPPTPPGVGAEL